MKKVLFGFMLIILVSPLWAQDSTVHITRDTLIMSELDTAMIRSYAKRYNPRKALLYAAVAPGLGQIYNKKYWKLPLVYGGFYLIGVQINKFNVIYAEYKGHLFYNLENNLGAQTGLNPNVNRTTSQLRRIVDKARRERDFWVIMMGGMYLLQIVDAHVDAHLKEFDLNPDLKVRLEPTMTNDAVLGRQTGVSVLFRF
jgi:hypothetical protein